MKFKEKVNIDLQKIELGVLQPKEKKPDSHIWQRGVRAHIHIAIGNHQIRTMIRKQSCQSSRMNDQYIQLIMLIPSADRPDSPSQTLILCL